jgi:hypothetical protein
MPTPQLIESLGAIVLCAVFVRLVMRGQWIAWTHPICSRCLFNLQGLPETSQRCPECGEELAKVRRHSVWRRRWISLGLSLVMILATAWVVSRQIPFRHLNMIMPTAALLRELQMPSLRTSAWNELWLRTARGELTPGQISTLVDAALKEPRYGSGIGILQMMQQRGMFPANKLAAAAAASIAPQIGFRRVVARGDPLVIGVVCSMWLQGMKPTITTTMRIDGADVSLPANPDHLEGRNYAAAYYWVSLPPDQLRTMSDGYHSVDFVVDVQVSDTASGKVVTSKKIRATSALTLLPAGKASIDVMPPDRVTAAARIRNYLALAEVYQDGSSPLFKQFDHIEQASGALLRLLRDGVDLSYQLLARRGGRIQPLGTMILSSETRRWTPATTRPSDLGESADIIFRPDPGAAARTIDIIHISGGEFTIQNVPVRPSPPKVEQK